MPLGHQPVVANPAPSWLTEIINVLTSTLQQHGWTIIGGTIVLAAVLSYLLPQLDRARQWCATERTDPRTAERMMARRMELAEEYRVQAEEEKKRRREKQLEKERQARQERQDHDQGSGRRLGGETWGNGGLAGHNSSSGGYRPSGIQRRGGG
eukprot:TRINITY_DN20568_c0_g1_i1.p1 TRINITY_DN20568_c0_g1~~TRINITY_DN20568_c0_g1_i1.p1  ORF type:complete len:153 (-),score=20.45 TRINITY_DN20568_c0_g1_i1:364-822(-)